MLQITMRIPKDCESLSRIYKVDEPICCFAGFELVDSNGKCLFNYDLGTPEFFGPNEEVDIYDWLLSLGEITLELIRYPRKELFRAYELDIVIPPYKGFICARYENKFDFMLIKFDEEDFLIEEYRDAIPPNFEIYDSFETTDFRLWCNEVLKSINCFLELLGENNSLRKNIWYLNLDDLYNNIEAVLDN